MKLRILLTQLIVFTSFFIPSQLGAEGVITDKPPFPTEEIADIEPIKPLKIKKLEPIALAKVVKPPAPKPITFSGNCSDWINGAGITDIANARELINRESGCNPYARNPSSGACGVAQELPCGKSGCALGNGACQVKWMNSYVVGRYGSWASAVAFHNANNWY